MRRRVVITAILAVLVVVAVLAAVKVVQIRSMMAAGASFTMPPETVSSARVQRVEWEVTERGIGTVTPVQGVTVRAQVPGVVRSIRFESGADVEAGDVLVELDRATEEADLRAAEARAELARANLERTRDLHRQQILSSQELDVKLAAFAETRSESDSLRATIAKKIIRAPFSGRMGIREVQLGQLLQTGDPIAPLQSVDPVHVDFSVPEQDAPGLHDGMRVRVTTDAAPDRLFEGRLTAISPEVDPATRNLRLQATFADTGGALRPGMSARVELLRDARITPLVVPVTSVLRAPYGDSAFVLSDVKDEATGAMTKRATMTTVKLGETRGDLVVVEHGLEEGQEVATSGVFKLFNGAAVVVDDSLAPAVSETPQPTQT